MAKAGELGKAQSIVNTIDMIVSFSMFIIFSSFLDNFIKRHTMHLFYKGISNGALMERNVNNDEK